MAQQKRIFITLPDSLLEEVDALAHAENSSRSKFVQEAMKMYLKEKRRIEAKEQMKKGYLEMGEINLKIAQDCLKADEDVQRCYEKYLSECE